MKLIGLTSSTTENRTFANTAYHNAFTRPGIVCAALSQFPILNREVITLEEYMTKHKEAIDGYVEKFDALVLTGGIDLNPLSFDDGNWGSASCDSERDMMELALLTSFVTANKPIMGICRGFQLAGQFLGLSGFTQDLDTSKVPELHNGNDKELKDRQEPAHITFVMGEFRDYMREKTARLTLTSIKTNSFHHQGFVFNDGKMPKEIKTREPYLAWLRNRADAYGGENNVDVIAHTPRIVEGIEKPDAKYVGVQWHAEEYGNQGIAIQYWLDKYLLA